VLLAGVATARGAELLRITLPPEPGGANASIPFYCWTSSRTVCATKLELTNKV
jgi:hypothetical protein